MEDPALGIRLRDEPLADVGLVVRQPVADPSVTGRVRGGDQGGQGRIVRPVGALGPKRLKTATPVAVPTKTRPLTIVGVTNLLPAPKASRPAAAWLEL